MTFKPLRRQSLAASVFEQLRDHIVDGQLAPGDALPAERVLAEKLGVNRQAVREGLKRLEQAGLVSVRQGEGTRVLDFRRTAGLELLASMIVSPSGVRTEIVRAVLEMRAAMAPDVARACAERAEPPLHDRLDALIAEMRASEDDLLALQDTALRFWGAVVEGADNVAYSLAFHTLDRTYRQVMEHMVKLIAAELQAVDLYAGVAEAVRSGDAAAAAEHATRIVALGTAAVRDVVNALDALEP